MADFYRAGGGLNATRVANRLAYFNAVEQDHVAAIDSMFVLFSGFLVFLMQAGFAMLTAGSVRTKNVKNVLLKNVLDACVGALAYWLFGYAFAFGSGGVFIGGRQFALSRGDLALFFFQWAFAATAATIVSGSVAERTSFYAYLGYAFLLTGFVYPVVSHWVWGGGFLQTWGMLDFAGCAVVHMVGGFAGVTGAVLVGPRLGRFADGKVAPLPGHSATLATLGTFVLWFGWYGFNPGSAFGVIGENRKLIYTVARCAVTTTLAAASGGVTTLLVRRLSDHIFDLISVLNGVLAGLVAITASCAFVETYAAVIIGAVGAVVYIAACELLLKLEIDDPLEAFPIHGATGFWGVIAAGLFNRRDLQAVAGYSDDWQGLFYGGRGAGKLLGVNLAGAALIALWTVGLIGPFFLAMKVAGLLRISAEAEMLGNDESKHGGKAYPEFVEHGVREAPRAPADAAATAAAAEEAT